MTLSDGRENRVHLRLHRFAIVGKGDTLYIDPNHHSRYYVVSSEDPYDKIKVSPHFEKLETLRIGSSEC